MGLRSGCGCEFFQRGPCCLHPTFPFFFLCFVFSSIMLLDVTKIENFIVSCIRTKGRTDTWKSIEQNLDEAHSSPGLHSAAGPELAEECATLVCFGFSVLSCPLVYGQWLA